MRNLPIWMVVILMISGCAEKPTLIDKPDVTDVVEGDKLLRKEIPFTLIADFPFIKDTSAFISLLRKSFDLEVDEGFSKDVDQKITAYRKVKIYGSNDEFIFLEYDYADGSGAAFPYKYQLLLTTNGKLVKKLSAKRYEFLEVFKNEHPFLLCLDVTYKGNGGHELYKVSADTLENVYEGYYDYGLPTYDAHQDENSYEPNELKLKVRDFNKDGMNDLSFSGTIITYMNEKSPAKKPVEFIFLYDKSSGHFKAKENYLTYE